MAARSFTDMRFCILRFFAFLVFLFSLAPFTSIAAQHQPSVKPAMNAKEDPEPRSLSGVEASDPFVSNDGRFSIALPKESLTSFSPFEPGKPQSGGTYEWEVKEGRFAIQYFDKPDAASFTTAERQQMLADGLAGALKNAGGTRITEEPSDLGSVTGRKIKLMLSGNQVMLGRAYNDRTRLYVLFAQPNSSLPGAEQLVTKVLDTFKIIEAAR